MKRCTLQTPLDSGRVRCDTCAHHCVIDAGEFGRCGVRKNSDGVLHSLVWGRLAAAHVDPIEKKPFYHFHPGAPSFSVATVGCNFTCQQCQNAGLSQMPVDQGRIAGESVTPEEIIGMASAQFCRVMAYTYTEPAVFWDYAHDTAVLAQEKGMVNVFVTNGFWSAQGIEAMLPVMDAANVDLKAFSDATYRQVYGGRLDPVLKTIATLREAGVWVEITTLVIPGVNDSDAELTDIARFLASVDPAMPWHVSRFHPTHRMTDRSATPSETLIRARKIGNQAGLFHVYTGNLDDPEGSTTSCVQCGAAVIQRQGFFVVKNRLQEGRCPECGAAVAGVWD